MKVYRCPKCEGELEPCIGMPVSDDPKDWPEGVTKEGNKIVFSNVIFYCFKCNKDYEEPGR